MAGLECGHKFCVQCWTEYLTTKIMDEGMGQVRMADFLLPKLNLMQSLMVLS